MSHGSQIPIFTMLELNPRSFSVFLGSKCQSQVRPENPHGIPMNAQREPPKKTSRDPTGLVWPGLFHAADWLPTLLCAAGADPFQETGTILNGASWDVRKSWENHGKIWDNTRYSEGL